MDNLLLVLWMHVRSILSYRFLPQEMRLAWWWTRYPHSHNEPQLSGDRHICSNRKHHSASSRAQSGCKVSNQTLNTHPPPFIQLLYPTLSHLLKSIQTPSTPCLAWVGCMDQRRLMFSGFDYSRGKRLSTFHRKQPSCWAHGPVCPPPGLGHAPPPVATEKARCAQWRCHCNSLPLHFYLDFQRTCGESKECPLFSEGVPLWEFQWTTMVFSGQTLGPAKACESGN